MQKVKPAWRNVVAAWLFSTVAASKPCAPGCAPATTPNKGMDPFSPDCLFRNAAHHGLDCRRPLGESSAEQSVHLAGALHVRQVPHALQHMNLDRRCDG